MWTIGLAGDAPESYDASRSDAADGDRARCRGQRDAAPGAGAVRPSGVDPDARAGVEPERVGGGGGRAVRSRPPAPDRGVTRWTSPGR